MARNKLVRLSAKQWKILFQGDGGGHIPFDQYSTRSINALEKRNLIYRAETGFGLTHIGMQEVNKKKLSDANRSKLEDEFFYYWEQYGNSAIVHRDIEGEGREHVYLIPDNDARFDFVFPQYKIAVEVQGGTWIKGAHSRGKGQTRDARKNNLAAAEGWQTLTFTSDMLARDAYDCIEQVLAVMRARQQIGTKEPEVDFPF